MWFNPLNHKANKDWVDMQLSECTPTDPASEPNGPVTASVDEAIQVKNSGYGWEDGTILSVHPDDSALVRWASGPTTTVTHKKISHAQRTAPAT